MVDLCTLSDIKAFVTPRKISDTEIQALITNRSNYYFAKYPGCNTEDANLKDACLFSVVSLLIRKMKFSGELAASIKSGSGQQNNSIDSDISEYMQMSTDAENRYRTSGFKNLFHRVGPGTVDGV